jgi:anti-anti-sigma factor
MRYAHQDQLSWLCFEGAIRYTQARELKAFLERVVLPDMGDTTVIDLREVESVDSTGLGLLASIGRYSLARLSRRAVILCPEGSVAQCLRAMKFDKLFTLTDALEEPAELALAQVAALPTDDKGTLASVMLDAHRELSEVDERNKQELIEVVGELEQSVAKGRH